MNKYLFKRVFEDLSHRVEVEGKKNPSWLMGYLQGLGSGTLTGFQCAALVDLLLVPLEKTALPEEGKFIEDVPAEELLELQAEHTASKSLIETLAQR